MDTTIRTKTEAMPFADDGRMMELSLMVPAWQANALLEAAEAQGMTLAQFLRRLVSQAAVAFPSQQLRIV